ncbi:zinc finger, PHD-type containing protein [Tanacetum coccineum]
MDVYFQPLVKELKTLWKKAGVKTLDVATNTEFSVRAMLLWTISDFPARSSLSGWSGQGYLACLTCNDETPSTHVNDKTFIGKSDNRPKPKKLTSARIIQQLADLPSRISGKHPSYGGVKRPRDPISILGTLLMNDKSKDTNKARQDLEQLNIRPELLLSKKGNGKFIKPHPVYSFTPEKRRKFCALYL